MPDSAAPATWTPEDVWGLIDRRLLTAKLTEIAEEMHSKIAEDKAKARAEGRKRGNAAFYPAERIRLEEGRADEWAEKIYQASLRVWETQGHKPCRAFYQAVCEYLLAPLFETRKGTVNADFRIEDQRTGQPSHSAAAQGAFVRAMDRLSSRWNRKMDVAAREYEYAMQREQGLLPNERFPGVGVPTAKLVEIYEAKQSTTLPNERVFPKGTQYEAFKEVTAILESATQEILIADNYMNDEVLDMLLAVPAQPNIRLLTFRPAPDFRVAVKRFQGQYQRPVEAKTHDAEIHDRAIVVDSTHFYALGGSIKDMGAKLTLLNKVEDATNIDKLRTELERIWASAVPLP
jgi:hypothetical protein